jgi:signal transduction histidine kinase
VNLVGNAIKFTERGEIFVTAKVESEGEEQVRIHFTVKDTGVGIPAEKQKKVFEAFSQADGSMARRYGGTGLGLTICIRLVEMMGGRIWVESEVGNGSAFQFIVTLECRAKARRESWQCRRNGCETCTR